jgi:hypothetical protein
MKSVVKVVVRPCTGGKQQSVLTGASGVGRSIAGQIEEDTLQFLGIALAAKDRELVCDLHDCWAASAHASVKESGRNNVYPREVLPLYRQRFAEVGHGLISREN